MRLHIMWSYAYTFERWSADRELTATSAGANADMVHV